MKVETSSSQDGVISFLNRDHVVSVTINRSEIVVITTVGTRIVTPVSSLAVAKFIDELTNDVDSNFLFVPAAIFREAPRELAAT